jgi:glycosyltransferase involved in cell wall biosynthesis
MHWMPFFAPAYASIAARLNKGGIPCSAIVHNALPHEKQPFASALTRRFMRHCDHIVALSETVRRDLIAMGVDSDMEVRPHPTYDQFGSCVERSSARQALGLDPDAVILLFFGLVRPYKGIDTLIEAMGRTTSQPHLIVAGEWYQDRNEAEGTIDALGLGECVRLDDEYIDNDRVALYFSAADAVVQPYRSATQSGVVQTAFHFGRPVIVTGVGGLPEVVRHEQDALVVAPEDPDALARAIDRMMDDGFRAQLTEGAAQARNRFTWDHFIQPFLTR